MGEDVSTTPAGVPADVLLHPPLPHGRAKHFWDNTQQFAWHCLLLLYFCRKSIQHRCEGVSSHTCLNLQQASKRYYRAVIPPQSSHRATGMAVNDSRMHLKNATTTAAPAAR